MPRYIDADKLKKEIELLKVLVAFARQSGKDTLNGTLLEYRKAVLKIIDEQPPADVAPKSEVDEMKIILATYGLQDRIRLAREIFEEIDRMIFGTIIPNDCAIISIAMLADLKKKYTEATNE